MKGRLVLFAALAALVAVIADWRLLDRDTAVPPPPAGRPGYYLDGVRLTEFGADGRPRLGLTAARANENPFTGLVVLEQVDMEYRTPDRRLWRMGSREARVPEGGGIVEFAGDVRLSGEPDAAGRTTTLTTGRLFLDPDAERATTDDEVLLAFGAHQMHARGLDADLKAGTLRLESDVHGRFTP